MGDIGSLSAELLDAIIDSLVVTVGIYKAVRLRMVSRTCET